MNTAHQQHFVGLSMADPDVVYDHPRTRSWPKVGPGASRCFNVLWKWSGYRPSSGERFHKATIAEWLYTSTRSVERFVSALEEAGLLTVRSCDQGWYVLDVHDPNDAARQRGLKAIGVSPSPQKFLDFTDDQPADELADVVSFGTAVLTTEPPSTAACGAAASVEPQESAVLSTEPPIAEPPPGLSEAVECVRAELGAERFSLWLADCRFELNDRRMEVIAPNVFACERLRASHLRAMRDAVADLPAVDGVFVSVASDSAVLSTEPPTPPRNAAQQPNHWLEPSKALTNPTTRRSCAVGEQKPTNQAAEEILRKAKELFHVIDCDTCYRWVCLLAALAIERGWQSEQRIDSLASQCAGLGTFNSELKVLLGKNYPSFVNLKKFLLQHGVKWERRYERNLRQEDSKARARGRRERP